MLNITPTLGHIFIKEIKVEVKPIGGLILPESAKEKALMRGEVLSCGKRGFFNWLFGYYSKIQVGAKVMFVKYSAAEVEGEGFLIRYEDVKNTYEEAM